MLGKLPGWKEASPDMQKIVPFQPVEHEILVVNSRFIASLSPASDVDTARGFIKKIEMQYSDASHHVPAYVIGTGNSVIAHCNDDGEPSGTAGRPALAVLQGSGIGDVVVVVTRYFGGTKLGKGGLVRAYGDAVREVLKRTPLAEIVEVDLLKVVLDYSYYEPLKRLLRMHDAMIENEEFAGEVSIAFFIQSDKNETVQNEIIELTSARAQITVLQTGKEHRKRINQTYLEVQSG
jgi:uncharacterized YigZ family protein